MNWDSILPSKCQSVTQLVAACLLSHSKGARAFFPVNQNCSSLRWSIVSFPLSFFPLGLLDQYICVVCFLLYLKLFTFFNIYSLDEYGDELELRALSLFLLHLHTKADTRAHRQTLSLDVIYPLFCWPFDLFVGAHSVTPPPPPSCCCHASRCMSRIISAHL